MPTTPANSNALPEAESKFVSGRNIADAAKLVRADIKAAIAAGLLPAGLKTSVRIDRYSMGQSLNVKITACPGVVVASVARVRFDLEHPRDFTRLPLLSAEATRIVETIRAIVAAYNYDRSDAMYDHFDVSFYGSVDFEHGLQEASRDEIAEAIRATAYVGAPSKAAMAPLQQCRVARTTGAETKDYGVFERELAERIAKVASEKHPGSTVSVTPIAARESPTTKAARRFWERMGCSSVEIVKVAL